MKHKQQADEATGENHALTVQVEFLTQERMQLRKNDEQKAKKIKSMQRYINQLKSQIDGNNG